MTSRAVRIAGMALPLLLLATLTTLVAQVGREPSIGPPDVVPASAGRPTVYIFGTAPDPHIVRAGGVYYAFATNGSEVGSGTLLNIQRYRSTDLQNWTRTSRVDALPRRPGWAEPTGGWMWAPAVFRASNGRYVMFYVARHKTTGRQCIGRATADEPYLAFQPSGRAPVVCQVRLGGSIDPYQFRNPANGRRFLYWKNDGVARGPGCATRLWVSRLDGNGNRYGEPARLLTCDRIWEEGQIENPAMTYSRVGDTYRLYYSGGWYSSTRYATGYAQCSGPRGPCRKITTGRAWHTTTPFAAGPGGAAFFADGGGKNWMAYHGYRPGRVGPNQGRFLFLEKVHFHRRPVIATNFPYAYADNAPHPFVDVLPSTWARQAIAWLARAEAPFPGSATSPVAVGIGYDPDELFQPRASITRAQLLNWVWKLEGHPRPYPAHPFRDGPAWIASPLDWAAAENLMGGWSDNSSPPRCGAPGRPPVFRPGCPTTRAAFVNLLWRAHGAPGGYPDPNLVDVPPTSWVHAAVSWAVGEGHMTGYQDGTFRPRQSIRRNQAANSLFSVYGP